MCVYFDTLKMLLHCLLTCIGSEDKSAIILIFATCSVMCLSPLWLLVRFSDCLVISIVIMNGLGIVAFMFSLLGAVLTTWI